MPHHATNSALLLPILRPMLLAEGTAALVVGLPFVPWLQLYVTTLDDSGARLVEAAEATSRGRSFAELAAESIANMAMIPAQIEPWSEGLEALRVVCPLGLASARLTDPSTLSMVERALEGRAALAIPAHDTLLATRLEASSREGADRDEAEDSDPLAWLGSEAARVFGDSDTPVSPMLYARDDEGIVRPLRGRPGGSIERVRLAGLAQLAAVSYEEQRTQLEACLLGDEGDCPRPVPLASGEHPSLGHVTVTLWIEGQPALLPRADLVRLVPSHANDASGPGTDEQEAILVVLDELRAVDSLGLVEHPDLRPTRLVTQRFPPPEVRARLRRL